MAGGVRVLAKSHEIRSPLLAKPIGRTAALKKKPIWGISAHGVQKLACQGAAPVPRFYTLEKSEKCGKR